MIFHYTDEGEEFRLGINYGNKIFAVVIPWYSRKWRPCYYNRKLWSGWGRAGIEIRSLTIALWPSKHSKFKNDYSKH